VAALLAARGAVIIDADVLAREVVAPGTPLLRRVADRFGGDVLLPDGSLDRPALGRVVFADPAARRDLEALIHPAVRRRAAELQAEAPDGAVVVHVIPLLVETGQAGAFDHVIVVDVPESTQADRMRTRDGVDAEAAAARIAAQASRAERLAAADIVIDNSGSQSDLVRQVDEAWSRLLPVSPRATAHD
jgi:dephospho-CoA kinase